MLRNLISDEPPSHGADVRRQRFHNLGQSRHQRLLGGQVRQERCAVPQGPQAEGRHRSEAPLRYGGPFSEIRGRGCKLSLCRLRDYTSEVSQSEASAPWGNLRGNCNEFATLVLLVGLKRESGERMGKVCNHEIHNSQKNMAQYGNSTIKSRQKLASKFTRQEITQTLRHHKTSLCWIPLFRDHFHKTRGPGLKLSSCR